MRNGCRGLASGVGMLKIDQAHGAGETVYRNILNDCGMALFGRSSATLSLFWLEMLGGCLAFQEPTANRPTTKIVGSGQCDTLKPCQLARSCVSAQSQR